VSGAGGSSARSSKHRLPDTLCPGCPPLTAPFPVDWLTTGLGVRVWGGRGWKEQDIRILKGWRKHKDNEGMAET